MSGEKKVTLSQVVRRWAGDPEAFAAATDFGRRAGESVARGEGVSVSDFPEVLKDVARRSLLGASYVGQHAKFAKGVRDAVMARLSGVATFTIKEAAKVAGVPTKTARRWVRLGFVKISRGSTPKALKLRDVYAIVARARVFVGRSTVGKTLGAKALVRALLGESQAKIIVVGVDRIGEFQEPGPALDSLSGPVGPSAIFLVVETIRAQTSQRIFALARQRGSKK